MRAAQTAQVQVGIHGRVPDGPAELAEAKVGPLLRAASEPVLSARVTLAVAADPAVARPAVAQATIDMNGRVLRAQAAGQTMRAAIGQMADRLQARLGRAARNWWALRGTIPVPEPGESRHQAIPAPVLPQARRAAGAGAGSPEYSA
jgi:ribosome-associated translation inhibitor RaiA